MSASRVKSFNFRSPLHPFRFVMAVRFPPLREEERIRINGVEVRDIPEPHANERGAREEFYGQDPSPSVHDFFR